MYNYLLPDYNLKTKDIFKSLFVSKYGLRHLKMARIQKECKWGHRMIALLEFCPILGVIISLIETILVKILTPSTLAIDRKKWIFLGTQQNARGTVSVNKVEAIRAKLESRQESSIIFNKNSIQETITGGTCSAMTFELAADYFKIKTQIQNVTFQGRKNQLLLKALSDLKRKFAASSELMRERQAAFNTIQVQKNDEQEMDYSKNKIQSLANYHDIKIESASNEIDVIQLNSKAELQETINTLSDGIYAIRILKPASNEKLEERGHTLLYVNDKEMGVHLFYDPNKGLRNIILKPDNKPAAVLFKSFKSNLKTFEISKARFYQLKPNLSPMNGSDSNSFPLEARKNKAAILDNMAAIFSEPLVRAS